MQVMNRDSEFLRRLIGLNIREIVINLFVAVVNAGGSYMNFKAFYRNGGIEHKTMFLLNTLITVFFLSTATRMFLRNRELRVELKETERAELIGNP